MMLLLVAAAILADHLTKAAALSGLTLEEPVAILTGFNLTLGFNEGSSFGVRQTPTFFLNGARLENFNAESLVADVRRGECLSGSSGTVGKRREQGERALADVMLDPFGIPFGRLRVKPETEQEPQHDLMPVPAFLGQRPALLGQKDRAILRAGDQAVPSQTDERLGDGGRSDAHPGRDVDRPRLAVFVDQFGDQFDVIFRQFIAPRLAHPVKCLCTAIGRAQQGLDGFSFGSVTIHHRSTLARTGLTRKAAETIISLV